MISIKILNDTYNLKKRERNVYLERIIESQAINYLTFLKGMITVSAYLKEIRTYPEDLIMPFWRQDWIPPLDAASLYYMVALSRPKRVIEIGSGNSTKFIRRSLEDHNVNCHLISIDPYPRSEIDSICDEIYRVSLSEMDLSFVDTLDTGDVIFVDSSHRAVQNSDVTIIFNEIIPSLKPGVILGFHDIFLPDDYPNEWLGRLYNEQYMLAAFLLGGGAANVKLIFCSHWLSHSNSSEVKFLLETLDQKVNCSTLDKLPIVAATQEEVNFWRGGCFWMSKRS